MLGPARFPSLWEYTLTTPSAVVTSECCHSTKFSIFFLQFDEFEMQMQIAVALGGLKVFPIEVLLCLSPAQSQAHKELKA